MGSQFLFYYGGKPKKKKKRPPFPIFHYRKWKGEGKKQAKFLFWARLLEKVFRAKKYSIACRNDILLGTRENGRFCPYFLGLCSRKYAGGGVKIFSMEWKFTLPPIYTLICLPQRVIIVGYSARKFFFFREKKIFYVWDPTLFVCTFFRKIGFLGKKK